MRILERILCQSGAGSVKCSLNKEESQKGRKRGNQIGLKRDETQG